MITKFSHIPHENLLEYHNTRIMHGVDKRYLLDEDRDVLIKEYEFVKSCAEYEKLPSIQEAIDHTKKDIEKRNIVSNNVKEEEEEEEAPTFIDVKKKNRKARLIK
jgi:hypothetical protein